MANNVKTVTPIAGTTLYTGAGMHPFRPGEMASVPADHADDLVGQGVVEHVPPSAPAPPR
jgi:hypothetical protein